jgi:hypothetical protein
MEIAGFLATGSVETLEGAQVGLGQNRSAGEAAALRQIPDSRPVAARKFQRAFDNAAAPIPDTGLFQLALLAFVFRFLDGIVDFPHVRSHGSHGHRLAGPRDSPSGATFGARLGHASKGCFGAISAPQAS